MISSLTCSVVERELVAPALFYSFLPSLEHPRLIVDVPDPTPIIRQCCTWISPVFACFIGLKMDYCVLKLGFFFSRFYTNMVFDLKKGGV
jgi:hypothetical protein